MPGNDRLLRAAARLLPREFRERVFEPALADVQLDEATKRRPFARAVLAVECLRLGIPQYFWRKGRPTLATFGVVALVVVFALSALVKARLRYAAEWKAAASGEHRPLHSLRP